MRAVLKFTEFLTSSIMILPFTPSSSTITSAGQTTKHEILDNTAGLRTNVKYITHLRPCSLFRFCPSSPAVASRGQRLIIKKGMKKSEKCSSRVVFSGLFTYSERQNGHPIELH